MYFDVFISRKTADKEKADEIERYLTHKGLKVFNSSTTISEVGDTQYISTMYSALYNSNNFIFIASKNIEIEPEWVLRECRVFDSRIIKKETNGNFITLVYDNLQISNLFYEIRTYEVINTESDNAYLEKILKFIKISNIDLNSKVNLQSSNNLIEEAKKFIIDRNYENAFIKLNEAIKSGYTQAYFFLGQMYFQGLFVNREIDQANKLYNLAIENNSLLGYYGLGLIEYLNDSKSKLARQYFQNSISEILSQPSNDAYFNNLKGNLYADGQGVQRNTEKGIEYYERAIAGGNSTSIHNLGMIYGYGKGVNKNSDLALIYFHDAIKYNLSYSFFELGRIYEEEKNELEKAIFYYQNGADLNNIACQNALGFIFKTKEYDNPKLSFEWHMKAALQQDPVSQNCIGHYYEEAIGCDRDPQKALYWYKEAASNGNAMAMSNVGYMYSVNNGIEPNRREAFEWFKKSAELGEVNGIYNLAYEYELGELVEKDSLKSEILYLQAAEKGYDKAQYKYGVILLNKKDYLSCKVWFEKAAKTDHAESIYNLGVIYELGLGVEPNFENAFLEFCRAAEKSFKPAYSKVAQFLMEGKGVQQSIPKAIEFYEVGSIQGDDYSMNELGVMYWKGDFVEKNLPLAKYWFEKAALKRNKFAFYNLGLMYENGLSVEKPDMVNAKHYYELSSRYDNPIAFYALGRIYFKEKNITKAKEMFEVAVRNGIDEAKIELKKL